MTKEAIINKVRKELGSLDAQGEQIVTATMKIFENLDVVSSPKLSKEHFVSNNIPLKDYRVLSRAERRRYHDEAEELNKQWVEKQFKKLKAKWMMVVDGQVVMHGTTLQNFPGHEALLALCKKTGKYPFAFFSPSIFAIEELPTPWHATKELGDAYPSLHISISGNDNRIETKADLDTGAVDCYASLRLLTESAVVKVHPEDIERTSRHLGRPFFYFSIPIWIELVDTTGKVRKYQTAIICVDDWHDSPFTAINPTRTFLFGRSVLLALQPRLILDFAAKQTEVKYGRLN